MLLNVTGSVGLGRGMVHPQQWWWSKIMAVTAVISGVRMGFVSQLHKGSINCALIEDVNCSLIEDVDCALIKGVNVLVNVP